MTTLNAVAIPASNAEKQARAHRMMLVGGLLTAAGLVGSSWSQAGYLLAAAAFVVFVRGVWLMPVEATTTRAAWKSALIHASLVVICLLTLYPVLAVVGMAFSDNPGFASGLWPLPAHPSLQNFRELFAPQSPNDPQHFTRQFVNSLAISAATTVVGMLISMTAAYAMSRFEFAGRRAGMTTLLATQMFPATMMSVPLYAIMNHLKLVDTMTGLILVYSTSSVPFCVWMLKGYFDTIPRDLEEAALLDGATHWQIFWRVVLPLARPALAVTALFSFMTAWNEYVLAATFLTDQSNFTLPVALKRFVQEHHVEWGHFAAGAIVVSVPVMAVFFALQKQLVGGLTAGGVKG